MCLFGPDTGLASRGQVLEEALRGASLLRKIVSGTRFHTNFTQKSHVKFLGGGCSNICSASVAMVSDSVRNTRSFDFSGLPRNVPEASGKGCLLGPFWGLFGRPPGLVWAQISVLRRVPGYTPGPKVGKMEALRPLLPILAISAKFHTFFFTRPGKSQIIVQIRVVKNGVRFCVKTWNAL